MSANLSTWPMALPGSKRKMILKLWPHMPRPRPDHRFVLPFFGTGADAGFMIDLGFRVAASDSQALLIEWHQNSIACVDRARAWIAEVEAGERSEDPGEERECWGARQCFEHLRAAHNSAPEAWSLWLLGRLAYGSLIRHNRRGEFNAPFGKLSKLPTRERMEQHAAFIGSLDSLVAQDFELAALSAELGDVVYLDPPYYGTYDAYTGEPFDHDRLIAVIKRLRERGITWALSNSVEFIEVLEREASELLAECEVHRVQRSGTMNSDPTARGAVFEVLIVWSAKQETVKP